MSSSYPDLDLNYLSSSGSHISYDEVTIRNSIKRILSTRRFSRAFNRVFGSRIEQLLFDPLSELTALAIRSEVFSVLETFEPRIAIDYGKSSVIPVYESNGYMVQVVYRIIMTGIVSETLVFMDRSVAYGY